MVDKNNYFKVITVDSYDFPTTAQCFFGFNSQGMMLLNRGSYTIEYSFDGETLHGDLNPNDASSGVSFDTRTQCSIWFRAVDGFGDVRVEAWSAN